MIPHAANWQIDSRRRLGSNLDGAPGFTTPSSPARRRWWPGRKRAGLYSSQFSTVRRSVNWRRRT